MFQVTAIARRIGRLLVRRLAVDVDATDPLAAESLVLAGLASAAVQGRLALGPRAGALYLPMRRTGAVRLSMPGSWFVETWRARSSYP